jgi:hypothetical protein
MKKQVLLGLALTTLSASFIVASQATLALNLESHKSAETTLESKNLLLAQNQRFPLRGSKFTELGDHRRMESSITISNNGRVDGVTRIWTAKQWKGFTGSVAVAITDRAGNVLYVTNPQSWGVDCKRCPGPSNRTQGWSDTVPSNVLPKVGGYAIIHTTNPRDRWRTWLSTAKEAVAEIKAIYSQF